MFHFHKVAWVHHLGEGNMFSGMCMNFIPAYSSAKIIKIERVFPELWSQMYCHLFYVTQCVFVANYTTLTGQS